MKKINSQPTDKLAKSLWDYNNYTQPLEKSDCIIVLGSNNIQVAKRGAELFLAGYAAYLLTCGNEGSLSKGIFDKAEAEVFSDLAVKMGVPSERILVENRSTNTGENIVFAKNLLQEKGLNFKKFIIVQQPYALRRAWAVFKKQWPEVGVIATSPRMSFKEYSGNELSRESIINILVGEIQRIKLYPEKGFQIEQNIPRKVCLAQQELIKRGFNKRLIEK